MTYCIHENYKILFNSKMYSKDYEFRKCSRCKLIFHFPLSESKKLEEHYTNYGNYSSPDYIKKEIIRRENVYKKIGTELKKLAEKYELGAKVLDVGCSNGILLFHLEKIGFDVYGVEVDSSSSKCAKDLLGEDRIFNGYLSESPFLNKTFDFVVCEQTIEHVENPFEVLSDIHKALKKRGVLRLTTPSFGGPSFRVLKDQWKNVAPNDHISMFDVPSIKHYMKEAGFNQLKIVSGGFLWNARRAGEKEFQQYNSKSINFLLLVIGKLLKYINKGDGLLVIARKLEI